MQRRVTNINRGVKKNKGFNHGRTSYLAKTKQYMKTDGEKFGGLLRNYYFCRHIRCKTETFSLEEMENHICCHTGKSFLFAH